MNAGKDTSNLIKSDYFVNVHRFNFLSISQLCNKENKVAFNSTQCHVSSLKISRIILSGLRIGNVYAINLDHDDSKNLACFEVVIDNAWHRRLDHASMHIIEKLSRHDLVRGPPNHEDDKDQVCSVYVRGKQVGALLKPMKTA